MMHHHDLRGRRALAAIGLLALGLALSAGAHAATLEPLQKSVYIGGLVGANLVNADTGSSTNTSYGVTAGTRIVQEVPIGVGVYGTYFSQDNSTAVLGLPAGTSTRTYNMAGEVNVFFSLMHVGGDVGEGLTTWDATAGNLTASTSQHYLIYGPEGGIDIPIGSLPLSIGGEAHYLISNSSGVPNNLQAVGALKVWL